MVSITYNWRYASQLEILEVVHLALGLFLRFGIFGIRNLPVSSTTGPALPLNVVMHSPRKGVNFMAVGTGENIKTRVPFEPKGDLLKPCH